MFVFIGDRDFTPCKLLKSLGIETATFNTDCTATPIRAAGAMLEGNATGHRGARSKLEHALGMMGAIKQRYANRHSAQ